LTSDRRLVSSQDKIRNYFRWFPSSDFSIVARMVVEQVHVSTVEQKTERGDRYADGVNVFDLTKIKVTKSITIIKNEVG